MGSPSYGRNRLVELFSRGMQEGSPPSIPPSYGALEEAAREVLDPAVFGFVAGSAGAERTAEANERAFERWSLRPRVLRDVETRDLGVDLFGASWPAPVGIAPIGVQSIYHEKAELATARAAASLGLPYVHSTVASTSLEAAAEAAEGTTRWFQLYWSSNRDLMESHLERAESAGYEAIVVTVDSPIVGWRERDVEQGYFPFMDGEGLGNYVTDPVFEELVGGDPAENEAATVMTFLDVFGDATLTWQDIEWLSDRVDLPVIVKGITHPEDAMLAVGHGADGIVVSTHGGRQVDNAVPAIEALPAVAEQVDERLPILFDSGIRRGADVVTALALGADAVFLGRPYIYGLAIDGQSGVEAVCRNLLADFDLTLGLAGRSAVDELDRSAVHRAGEPL